MFLLFFCFDLLYNFFRLYELLFCLFKVILRDTDIKHRGNIIHQLPRDQSTEPDFRRFRFYVRQWNGVIYKF